MKHAIMVIGYGEEAKVLQETINILDDKDIDFFIHWDKKYTKPILRKSKSKIYYISNPISVKWGSSSLIKATIMLMEKVEKSPQCYDYAHLISSNDIPLMTKGYFKSFFTKEAYIGFSRYDKKEYGAILERVKFYYPDNIDFRKHPIIYNFCTLINKALHINRLNNYSNLHICKGSEWFSIKADLIKDILDYKYLSNFFHGNCADEIFIPTIFSDWKNTKISENRQAARYIDWNRGTPYTFTLEDKNELNSKINTQYAFARKVVDPELPKCLFELKK
ncbi:beta-1,6-N-acetylglucosaminyltransferase [Lactobacillus gallinarum]|uniref:beta-1,6-N-acetylglucosaminyltransferase n=1 Tax=Lactobacillus gallinarum TaxID=52242 RepID=UPI00117A2F7D|nr:beta-1,6-N-acetylglucosaminyltransferase [Lactobacillus gallinarum]